MEIRAANKNRTVTDLQSSPPPFLFSWTPTTPVPKVRRHLFFLLLTWFRPCPDEIRVFDRPVRVLCRLLWSSVGLPFVGSWILRCLWWFDVCSFKEKGFDTPSKYDFHLETVDEGLLVDCSSLGLCGGFYMFVIVPLVLLILGV